MLKDINVIFQGGGIKGLAYVGVLRYLEENGYRINNVSGTSVGAVIASLIAVGYDSYELENILNTIPLEVLLPKESGNKVLEKIKSKGLYSMTALESYLEKLYLQKNKRVFADIKVGNCYKAIFISTSLKLRRIFVLPYDLKMIGINPDSFPIAKAVCMSACLPLVYQPYVVNGYTFIDGGASDNFPKWCFNDALSFRLSKEKPVTDFFRKQIFGKIESNNTQITIDIKCDEYRIIDFKKGLNDRYILYNRGYQAVKKYFEKQY